MAVFSVLLLVVISVDASQLRVACDKYGNCDDKNLCIDLPGGDTTNGNFLWLWECNGGGNQQWLVKDGAIRFASQPDKCIDIPGGAEKGIDGNTFKPTVWIWDCIGAANQHFEWEDGDQQGHVKKLPAPDVDAWEPFFGFQMTMGLTWPDVRGSCAAYSGAPLKLSAAVLDWYIEDGSLSESERSTDVIVA